MHETCHAASSVSEPDTQSWIEQLIQTHRRWREKFVVVKAVEIEHAGEISSLSRTLTTKTSEQTFLDHPPVHVTDFFFSSRLNHWRAIGLHLSLIREPRWGKAEDGVVVEAIDLCRTHAALGSDCDFLAAEHVTGLYLAGVIFGGPDMYSVPNQLTKTDYQRESQWIIDELESRTDSIPITTTLVKNLNIVWTLKGNYWDTMKVSIEDPQ